MIYNIPSLKKNGISFSSGEMIVPEATNTYPTSFNFNFENYVLDLTGQEGRLGGDTVNTIYMESYTFIDSTGTLETINNTDSFYSYVEFDLTPEYAKGYLGSETINLDPKENILDIFNNMTADNFELKEVDLKLYIQNYIGADFQIDLVELKGQNSKTNNEVILAENKVININRATLSSDNLPINQSITELIIPGEYFMSILPDRLISTTNISINPNGQNSIQDFFYPEYPIETTMSLSIPLSLITENLTFIDTTEVDVPNSNEYIINKIHLGIENGLPFESNIQLILLDENDLVIDTLINNAIITAAQVDANNIVVNSRYTDIEMDYIDFENVKKMIAISHFTTHPVNQFIDIYSHYNLDINLSANVRKRIGKQ
jgi:hypothetical protein